MSIDISNKISPSLISNIPQFIKLKYPVFVSFIEAYYEWLENQGSYLRNPLDLQKTIDIDTTFDEFISSFKNQYLLNFPENLAINQDTGQPLDSRKLIKHIKSFYEAKGTEKTYELLFKILYDTNVEFYYPKLDILRISDGKWISKKSIRTTSSLGKIIFDSLGKKINQRNLNQEIIASASVSNITRYQLGVFEITEIELSNISGNFSSSVPIEFTDNSGNIQKEQVYSVISNIIISNGGSKYKVGDQVVFTNSVNDSGQKASAKVSQVDSNGKILQISIDNFGVNYNSSPSITINSNKGTGFSGYAVIGSICNYQGYYANNDGKISSNKVIQDNHYYQNYSYVLKTEIVIDRYKNIIKKLIHPAGLGFFGQVLIKRQIKSNLNNSNNYYTYDVPIIGHYLPYTNKTYDDLSLWFVYGGTHAGYYPGLHDSIIITGASGNPISNNLNYVPGITSNWLGHSNFINADPFWITYRHPNLRITDNVLAKIYSNQKNEFLGTGQNTYWNEWQVSGTSDINRWETNFTGDFKYAILKYNNKSEFRKITIGGFLSMPIGDHTSPIVSKPSSPPHTIGGTAG